MDTTGFQNFSANKSCFQNIFLSQYTAYSVSSSSNSPIQELNCIQEQTLSNNTLKQQNWIAFLAITNKKFSS